MHAQASGIGFTAQGGRGIPCRRAQPSRCRRQVLFPQAQDANHPRIWVGIAARLAEGCGDLDRASASARCRLQNKSREPRPTLSNSGYGCKCGEAKRADIDDVDADDKSELSEQMFAAKVTCLCALLSSP